MSRREPSAIRIRGARVHNLKNLTLDIPRNRLVVVTGISGSGKSSLAFDTLYAEGQRRYVESLSAYARQFLQQMPKPDVDGIDGLSPAISIEQKAASSNPRSTVATVTEIYDFLRLFWARVGIPHCPACGEPIAAQTVQQMVDAVLSLSPGTRFSVLAPLVRGRKGEQRELLVSLRQEGFSRVRIDGSMMELDQDIKLDGRRKHDIAVYVDRLVAKAGIAARLTDSMETALRRAGGLVEIETGTGETTLFSEHHACVQCGLSLPELSPRLFSFNSPHGACQACDGLGTIRSIDPAMVVPDPDVSLADGALLPLGPRRKSYHWQMIEGLALHLAVDLDLPFGKLPAKVQQAVLYGTGDDALDFHLEGPRMSHRVRRPFEGVITNLERRYRETSSQGVRAELEEYMTQRTCDACGGSRLRPEALAVRIDGANISDFTRLSVQEALAWIDGLSLEPVRRKIAERIIHEIRERLRFMQDVGVAYLTLDRGSATLAGGEGQRIRLATQIGAALSGVLYVLDEPTVGLHPRDCRRLLATLENLRDRGNTVVVVEHDPATVLAADHVIDMGPGAGRHGGEVVAEGRPSRLQQIPASLTGAYLAGRKAIAVPVRRKPKGGDLRLEGARGNNLKDLDVTFFLGLFNCVTGVSGSGKSTLVIDTLYRGLARRLHRAREIPAPHRGLKGLGKIDKVVHIDQAPIGRTPRSNPATYTGVFTAIRSLFAKLPESQVRGYGPGRYSFNVKGGRCEACGGGGEIRVEMHFLPDMYVTCEACGGRRFNRETLEVRLRGMDIAGVLELTVREALEFFAHQPAIQRKLQTLVDVGLGYLQLGQNATTLSGGEAQRIKLARELSRRATGRTLYILDEPTTGLHMDDIRQLLEVLNRLVDDGNTVVVIEHNLDVIKQADHLIDLGPEGGEEGGRVVATGTPEQLARIGHSHTGEYLAASLRTTGRTGQRS